MASTPPDLVKGVKTAGIYKASNFLTSLLNWASVDVACRIPLGRPCLSFTLSGVRADVACRTHSESAMSFICPGTVNDIEVRLALMERVASLWVGHVFHLH